MRWIVSTPSDDDVAALAAALGLPKIVAGILAQRGYQTPELASAFLNCRLADLPDPMTMKGMDSAVARLVQAIQNREKITLYGDYDVDGVCSTALLSLFLEEVGVDVNTYIPHRLEEGYGLNGAAVQRLADEGYALLVTLDCGITSRAEVDLANSNGMEVIIVDHHSVPEKMPDAVAVLNPHQPGCNYPTRHLCAAGVAFNLCMGVRKRLRELGFFESSNKREPNLKGYLDLVALATVADVVPLTGANRILVTHGLKELTLASRPGIAALKEVSGLRQNEEMTAGQLGFRLGPRINAAGRLDDASLGLQLLRSQSLEVARPLAEVLDKANGERQVIEARILNEAMAQAESRLEQKGWVLFSEGWHPGVVGIVASRVVERFHRPTVVVGVYDGMGRGSGRSIEGFHLLDALHACAPHMLKYGGHKHAAGLSVAPENLPALSEAFALFANERLTEEALQPRCHIDAVVDVREWNEDLVEALERLGPFGNGNPQPVFASRRLVAQGRVLPNKVAGRGGHLKMTLESAPAIDVMGFGMADKLSLLEGPVDMAYQVSIDEWNGRRKLSWKLKSLRLSS